MRKIFNFILSLSILGASNLFAAQEQLLKEEMLISHVQNCIALAEQETSQLTPEILAIPGMSSTKIRHFLNNLCSLPNTRYLEVGVWKGSTYISALYGNEEASNHAVGFDNWSEFGGPFPEFLTNMQAFLPNYEGKFFSVDCFAINKKVAFPEKVTTYFYDGSLSLQSQKAAFTYFNDVFEEVFIAVIDDWNFQDVQKGTAAAFQELKYDVLFETVLPARYNGDSENWWNGLYVAVIRKPT
jgi:hypothetical protein